MPARPGWLIALLVLGLAGCHTIGASNHRDWSPDQAVLPYAEIDGDAVTVRNIRNCDYESTERYQVRHYDKTFDLDKIQSVDFIVVPFSGFPALAHTFISFGFEDDEHLAVSVEVRKEKGEQYSALKGLMNQYEIMYVVGDERDLIGLRANHRLDDVYVYRTIATPTQAKAMFLDVMQRTNQLAERPEFYHLVTNNCTTNVAQHVNRLSPHTVPWNYQVLLPGFSDRLAYDLGLLATAEPFEVARSSARVNRSAYLYRDSSDFSTAIRR